MPRSCMICRHPQRTAIEQALGDAIPLRIIADQWSVSKSALIRHKQAHLPMRPMLAPIRHFRPGGDSPRRELPLSRDFRF
jgi:hypothetical protein